MASKYEVSISRGKTAKDKGLLCGLFILTYTFYNNVHIVFAISLRLFKNLCKPNTEITITKQANYRDHELSNLAIEDLRDHRK